MDGGFERPEINLKKVGTMIKKRELCFCLEALASLGLGMVSPLVSDFIF